MTRRIQSNGLAPSTALAPSLTLAPRDTIYAGGPIAPHVVTMAVGVGGTYVDVSSYVEFGEGVSYTYGRQTQFDDTSPGTFTFTLDNSDGRFTPDNPTSPLAVKVTEGLGVCWQLGTRLVHGKVLAVEIPANEAAWNQLVVTCDDMLGTAGRHQLTSLADGLLEEQLGDLLWRLDEPSDAVAGAEAHGDGLGAFTVHASNPSTTTQALTFGVPQVDGLPGTAVTLTAAAGETNWFGTRFGNTVPVSAVTNRAPTAGTTQQTGWWNFWVYPGSTCNLAVTPAFANYPNYSLSMQIQVTPTTVAVKAGLNAAAVYSMTAAEQLAPHYLSMKTQLIWQPGTSSWALWCDLYIDGIYRTHTYWSDGINGIVIPSYAGAMSPVVVNVSTTGGATSASGTFQRVSHAYGLGLEQNALYNRLDQRRAVVDTLATDISSATYKGPLSSPLIGYPSVEGQSVLDVYNDIVRSEAGSMFCLTFGTVTAPTEQIQIRARDRPSTPKAVFDVVEEVDGPPTFVRDITNVAQQTGVSGPNNTVTVVDATVTGRYIMAGTSETVLYAADEDLREWGQDRLYRGRNVAVRAQTFTVDATSTPTDRSTDLLALVPGDRIRLANTPAARLGFASWDGWLLGGSESHTHIGNRFTFTLTPTIPDPAATETARAGNGGAVNLTAACTAADTTLAVTSTATAFMSTDTPYTCTLGTAGEQITVTAVSGTTLTVVRGVNGTTAIAHATAAPIEPTPVALYAY